MLKTLHGYLSWDLARTMLLALVAFTLVMTVFAVIEPMRKQGLDGTQVLSLFGYTIPVMLSLTMPVAALFASTFVYGRFSQDNELMACRASGIAAMTLLRPALVLGVMITAASLYLSNSVAPDLAERANQSIKNNVRGFAYSQLRQKGMVKHEAQILFADDVDEEHNTIYGMMLLDHKDPNDILIVMAPQTQLQFVQQDGEMYASVWMEDTVVARTGRYDVGRQSSAPIDSIPLRSPIKEDPSWYRWDRLRRTMANPAQNAEISRRFQRIRREIGQEMLAKEIMKAVQTGKAYDFKGPVNNSLTINAPIHRQNIHNVPRMIEFAVEQGAGRDVRDGQLLMLRRRQQISRQRHPTGLDVPTHGRVRLREVAPQLTLAHPHRRCHHPRAQIRITEVAFDDVLRRCHQATGAAARTSENEPQQREYLGFDGGQVRRGDPGRVRQLRHGGAQQPRQ